jgi:S1-C subfamily serine protease
MQPGEAAVLTMIGTERKSRLAVLAALSHVFIAAEAIGAPARECGWIGIRVSAVSKVMAESLGMDVPYGGISEPPELDSPAAAAKIEAGDLITAINDTPLMNAQDFSPAIAAMAPGTTLYLSIPRNGQPREISLILGSGKCEAGP